MKKFTIITCATLIGLGTAVGSYYYHKQDELIFRNKPLARDYQFKWETPFEELFIPVGKRGGKINALHFFHPEPKGVVLFCHGQGRNLAYWGKDADLFLSRGYEVFVIDYRGYGKSSPHIKGFKEKYVLKDAEAAYEYLKTIYPEEKIVVYGQSLGSAVATWVASKHSPKMLILEAPYYNMHEAAAFQKPHLPKWLIGMILKFPLRTNIWIRNVNSPIYIFHGTDDIILPYAHSQKLYNELKDNKEIEMITLNKWGHDRIDQNDIFLAKLTDILKQ